MHILRSLQNEWMFFALCKINTCSIWWHISATRYEIALMIILSNYRDRTNFPGNSIEIANCFTIKVFLTVIMIFLRSCPQVTLTISIIRYGFGSSLPSCTAKTSQFIQTAIFLFIDIEKRVGLLRRFYLDVGFVHE